MYTASILFCDNIVGKRTPMSYFMFDFQGEKKEKYIEIIQTLDFGTKAAIAVHIQEVSWIDFFSVASKSV